MKGRGKREYPSTNGIVQHDSHVVGRRFKVTALSTLTSHQGEPGFRKWESCRTMPLVGGFSRGSPVFPAPSFLRRSIFTSITLISSEDLAVKSRLYLFTHSLNPSLRGIFGGEEAVDGLKAKFSHVDASAFPSERYLEVRSSAHSLRLPILFHVAHLRALSCPDVFVPPGREVIGKNSARVCVCVCVCVVASEWSEGVEKKLAGRRNSLPEFSFSQAD
ncbi:hypothetical protein PR048_015219 [Dryococelus australis]|uniref:Uncharacterized protein n=1 Tax=Dryococelus australis TaxID=614101 RepID=A0ABQ9HGC3_9NEOP|nr:hypothetical protein PR048_015219 [Dryococelus australis]